jgi:hypothetical protein
MAAFNLSGQDAQSQALSDAILKTKTPALNFGPGVGKPFPPPDVQPYNPTGLYQTLLKTMSPGITPASLGNPNSLMLQQGRMHQPLMAQSPEYQRLKNQAFSQGLYKDSPARSPQNLASAAGTAGIAAYRGYNQGTAPNATEADRAGAVAGTIGGGANAASSLLPGWYGKIAQLAGLMAGEYGKDKTAQGRGERLKQIYSIQDETARNKALAENM